MAAADADEQKVTYSVKELLNRIDGKLDNFALAIAQKAEQSHVDKLEQRIELLESDKRANVELSKLYLAEWENVKSDVKHLKEGSITQKSVDRYKKWLTVTMLAAIGSFSGLVVAFAYILKII